MIELTQYQHRLAQHRRSGFTNAEIASLMNSTEGRVEQHFYHLYRKFGVRKGTQFVLAYDAYIRNHETQPLTKET